MAVRFCRTAFFVYLCTQKGAKESTNKSKLYGYE